MSIVFQNLFKISQNFGSINVTCQFWNVGWRVQGRTWSCPPSGPTIFGLYSKLQKHVMWQWNGNFAGFLEKFLNNSKNYPMKWNLQFSGKWQNWQISQILCIGELEVKVLILEVAMVNVCQFAPNIFSMTSKLYWGHRPRCNPKNLILQIFDFFCLILWHWYQK